MLIIEDYEVLDLNPRLTALLSVVEGMIGHLTVTMLGPRVFDEAVDRYYRNFVNILVDNKRMAEALKAYLDKHFCYDRTEAGSSCCLIFSACSTTLVQLQVSRLTVKKCG